MRLSKNLLIVCLLLGVFAVGTLSFVDTVSAANWKKYDSGTIKSGGINIKFTSYIKGNQIMLDMKYKNKLLTKTLITKYSNKVTIVGKNSKGKVVQNQSIKTKMSLKNCYKYIKQGMYS